jgi:hypothetical protein
MILVILSNHHILLGENPIYSLLSIDLSRKPRHMFSVGTHLCHYALQRLTQDVSERLSVTCVAACVSVWSQTIFHFVTIVYFISRTDIKPCCSSFESDTNNKEVQHWRYIISQTKTKPTYLKVYEIIFDAILVSQTKNNELSLTFPLSRWSQEHCTGFFITKELV